MIGTVVVAAVALGFLAYVAAALAGGPRHDVPRGSTVLAEAEARKRAALEALIDLDSERDSGKLGLEEYESLRSTYELEAVGSLRALDSLHVSGHDDAIEDEIARLRDAMRCPSCRAPRRPGERCERCGSAS